MDDGSYLMIAYMRCMLPGLIGSMYGWWGVVFSLGDKGVGWRNG